MTTLNCLLKSWDSFIRGICARQKLIKFSILWEECTQEEARLVAREEKMGANDDQALTTHAKKDRSKEEDQPHIRPKRFQKNHRRDYSSLRCYTYDEKCHFARDLPKNKVSTKENKKKRHHVHTVEHDEPINKRTREYSSSDEEYVLILSLTGIITHGSNDWIVDSLASKHMTGYK